MIGVVRTVTKTLALILVLGAAVSGTNAAPYLLVYSTVHVPIDMVKVPFNLKKATGSHRILVLATGTTLYSPGDYLSFGPEFQIAKHIKGDHHWEFNAAWVCRWERLPWDRWFDTSLALAPGVSYASRIPGWEGRQFDNSSRVLAYLAWEIAGRVPRFRRMEIVARLHHRSGMYGLIDGVSAGTNAVGLGLRLAL